MEVRQQFEGGSSDEEVPSSEEGRLYQVSLLEVSGLMRRTLCHYTLLLGYVIGTTSWWEW